MNGYENFEKIIKGKNITTSTVTKATGINASTFTAWKKGQYMPKPDKLQKIADYLGVTVEFLTTGEDKRVDLPEYTPEIIVLIDKFCALSEADRKDVFKYIDFLNYKQQEE